MSSESNPKSFKRLRVQKLSANFREAVVIEETEICHPKEEEVCIRNKYVGINASDINVTKGLFPLIDDKKYFGVGFEGIGEVVDVGKEVKHLKKGDKVAYMTTRVDSFSEYVCVAANEVYSIPEENPDYLVLLVSGITASIGLDKCGRIMAGEKVLITAAAGGAGHIAVQWAKAADCHVIGTCSSEDKEEILKELGCDRVINYKEENVAGVLATEYEGGIDVVWETIGGEMFETCLVNLAMKGRLVIVGGTSSYKNENEIAPEMDISYLPAMLISKSASLHGFRRGSHRECFPTYFKYLTENFRDGKLRTILDTGVKSTGKEFFGMEGIIRGVEHLHSGKSIGKVVARLY